ncbi:bifunctional [glutamine synthetase] adenylyltransferase/[glutamine synthetase]-adenylyl-L-tyrosine phosphorylase [Nakamurella antarctica]|uniref:Bifunctional [glutamine synthetase] adenylyltransferase/[glutamine synthetase]-adenylyl-L-tyrosine phosphorylase n=1 Tax=Nakamurella antarctica TaxID=1902245 RepID=A0A3G8ZLV9_9ACTN|nr:bifunctional [glutamine synthetase] adenylyltransferase/[glutamine synthetase]-adenylyl-L-tyrosine phosphorylase [Nakamurella antarctica]AZI57815.1 bifunctional [glutamine synthetase] adenylyltransferase/[glutamine synthetase]-adenylyl-L-tyrosine phosphorylase [Nakamurella antarctica]
MSRPQSKSLLRYGLGNDPRVQSNLTATQMVDVDGIAADCEDVLAALSRSGRPELALHGLARLAESSHWSSILENLKINARFRGRLVAVLGASTALSDHLAAHPGDWKLLLPEATGAELIGPTRLYEVMAVSVGIDPAEAPCTGTEGAKAKLTGGPAVVAMRNAYRSQLLIIAAHDLAQSVEPSLPPVALPAVCHALSDLADATLQVGLSVACAALSATAAPVALSIVAMGKCGARELNYISDVDVIFVADHPPAISVGVAQDDHHMLISGAALASQTMRICEQVAWEVDAGLRPEGGAGALVRTPASFVAYYQRWAQTWEFQALLKARPAAGSMELGAQFMAATQSGVWTAAGRESFVDDVQAMRRRVEANIPEGLRDKELKLGPGGLRDVEFSVQLLQLVHGRSDPELRIPGTLTALRALIRGGYVGRSDGAELAGAYTFLRRAEHRIQLQRLRRTHILPDDHADLDWLARTDGYTAFGTSDAAEIFTSERARHAAIVRKLHEKLFYRPLLHAVAAVPGEEMQLSSTAAAERLKALGFRSPEAALRHLAALTTGVSRRAAIQRTLLPVMLDTFAASPDPDGGLLSYRHVSEALADTPWYLRLLRDEGLIAQRLAGLLGSSKLVGDLLARAPEVLRLLVTDAELLAPEPVQVAASLLARAARGTTAQDSVDVARSARRHELLRLACADMLGLVSVQDVAVGLSAVADATVQAAYAAAHKQVAADRPDHGVRMAVIGMGRFGGAELGYSSDADVMYVAEPLPGVDQGEALNTARLISDLMARLLSRPSPDPALEVDADLRPEGKNGPMVRTLESFQAYWKKFALPWERQALLRARYVAGESELGSTFIAAADEFRYPSAGLAQQDVIEIRRIKARVDVERLPRGADPSTHTKLGSGGLSDVEWTVQLLQLQHAFEVPGLRTPQTRPAISAACDAGLLSAADASALDEAWLKATHVRNVLMQVLGKPEDQIPRQGRQLAAVARAMGYPAGGDPGEFVDEYRRTSRRARWVVDRVFSGGG